MLGHTYVSWTQIKSEWVRNPADIILIEILFQLMKVLLEVHETLTAFSTKRERFNQIFKKGK